MTCACISPNADDCARIRYGRPLHDGEADPCDCSCHDEDEDCHACGASPCECAEDDFWHDDYDLDGCRVFDAHGYLTGYPHGDRKGRALMLAIDRVREPTRTTIRAIARTLSPVGAPLGGHSWQRRLRRLRAMQAERKHARNWRCPQCGLGTGLVGDCQCNPF
jgi:hypothetical protein